jgi:DNA polymerase-3 subunit beta
VKLSVMQENLARGLALASRAVSARTTLPILSNVLLRTGDGGLRLTTTNLEIGIAVWVPGRVEDEGAITVPARLLTDLVGSFAPSERVDLEVQGGEVLFLRCGRLSTHLRGMDAEEFPAVGLTGERPTTRVAQGALRSALHETTFAAASDEARPILTGVYSHFEGERLTLAAADNYRIAVTSVPLLDPVESATVVIPARALAEVERILGDGDEPAEVVLATARNQVLFRIGDVELVSRLIDGQFPNYQQVLPKGYTTRIVVDRDELSRALRPAALIASSSANIVKLVTGEGSLLVTAAAEVGDTEAQVEAQVEGEETTIAFNARYLSDVLSHVEAERFALEFNGPLAPGVFRPEGRDDYVHVVMPVRTTS